MSEYWVYENNIHKKTRVHLASCSFCQNGRGIHGGGKRRSGIWFGPFATIGEADSKAGLQKQPDNRHCQECLPKGDDVAERDNSAATEQEFRVLGNAIDEGAAVTAPLSGTVRMSWVKRGRVEIDERGKPLFPAVPDAPGLYRLHIVSAGGDESVYIGESANLRRRFGNYRNPGPTQETSLRINGVIRFALESGGHLSIATADDIVFEINGAPIVIDLNRTSIRRMLENFAISLETAEDVESLNL